MTFVAFLRGINVGGHKPVKMEELRAAFSALGFAEVRTVQASGNVVFEVRAAVAGAGAGEPQEVQALVGLIAAGLERGFGYPMQPVVRSLDELETLAASEPFAGVPISPTTRLYVTFLSSQAKNVTGSGLGKDHRVIVVRLTGREVLTAIDLAPGWGTSELMAWLEKTFGRDVTTRNWNTILKILGR